MPGVAASRAGELTGVPGLVRGNQAVELPGFGRVVLSFLLVIAIGLGVMIALRRLQPRWRHQLAGAKLIKVLERSRVGDVRVYLLSVSGRKVLLSEHRSGITTVILEPDAATAELPQS